MDNGGFTPVSYTHLDVYKRQPEENVKDLAEIPDNVKNHLEIVPVRWIDKVLELALERLPEPLSLIPI